MRNMESSGEGTSLSSCLTNKLRYPLICLFLNHNHSWMVVVQKTVMLGVGESKVSGGYIVTVTYNSKLSYLFK